MILGRRIKPGWRRRVRMFFWPESGPKRAAKYLLKRISRLDASPHAIAAGFAAGAAVSFTPFIGFHFLIGFALAWVVRGNLLASALGTAVGNPLTFPFIFASTYETGRFILGLVETPAAADVGHNGHAVIARGFFSGGFAELWPVVKTMTVGAIPLGLVAFVALYLLVRSAATGFQHARRARRVRRAAKQSAGAPASTRVGQPDLRQTDGPGSGRNPVDRAPAQPSG